MKLLTANSTELSTVLDVMQQRRDALQGTIQQKAQDILNNVQQNGWEAVTAYSQRFDGCAPYEISQDELKAAYDSIDADLRAALHTAHDQIYDYQKRLVTHSAEWRAPNGGTVGQLVRPVNRVGLYVPGGTAAYPSSVLANAVPAKAAGVPEIIMVTPPTTNLKPSVLAAAYIAGVDRVVAVGGVQAVAALVYGCGPVPKVNKLVGPGNAYVAAAKRLVYGQVDIDMIAGPSEILIIADETANPRYIAADLLSQAEHDCLAQSILLSPSETLLHAVRDELANQLNALARKDITAQSLADFGLMIQCADLQECARLANGFAPEHLEIITAQPRELLPAIENAGAVFLGAYSPEPLGDYMAGPSHVLPTSGSCRFFSPLSAESFLKKMSLIEFERADLALLKDHILCLANEEGLTAHANSIAVRFTEGGGSHEQ